MTKGKYFFVQTKLNGMVLDIEGGNCECGTRVITWPKKDGVPENQLWRIDHVTDTIRSKMNSNMCIEINDNNSLIINEYEPDNDNQKWRIAGEQVENVGNGDRVLDVAANDESEGARICAWEKHSQPNQCWEIENLETQYFFIRSELNGKVLDIKRADSSAGTKVITWDQHEEPQDNQIWYENEYGVICSKLNDMAIDASDENGKSMRMQPFDLGDAGKLWTVRRERVINQRDTERVMDIKRGEDKNGAKLIAYAPHDGENQKWKMDFID